MVLKPTQPSSAGGEIEKMESIECGKEVVKQFSFGDGYRNLNHGSYGTYPLPIRSVLRHYQDEAEARPDKFIRYDYPKLLDESRAAVAKYLNAPVSTCVYITNATTGLNTVLRNLVYETGDVIIYFATIYGACEKSIDYITETTPAESRKIEYTYPISDQTLCDLFEEAISATKAAGKVPKLAIFDTIVSLPGVRMPFEALTALSHQHGLLSCIDGAHGIGHIPLDLTALDPDFFFSNCHKWLHVPRACAVFYVPERNQHLLRSTLPTSHGFAPLPKGSEAVINNPMPPSGKSAYITNFEYVATLDNSPYLCIPAALEWRSRLSWQGKKGEEAIMAYTIHLAREAGKTVSSILSTEVMENKEGTLSHCNFANVRLPLASSAVAGSDRGKAVRVAQWMEKVLVEEYNTFIAIIFYEGAWWVRLSSQVYLTVEDFEWAAGMLKTVCERVEAGEWEQ
ncbi:hypothetical protein LTR36_007825 [Oleoguttula mirabilis]|uniref:Aminotransferase class V domain-containing protein n=1 Tax=Oleoguttula mirabilis TaxID=1507867 RepID=A0AAV9J995_9PEZI|nr:hypothetical protein LTR36_007825 [Oleoguttula mirabilis]